MNQVLYIVTCKEGCQAIARKPKKVADTEGRTKYINPFPRVV